MPLLSFHSLHVATPIREAVEAFEEYKINGAPVVDESGKPVGVLSASDITTSEHIQEERIGRPAAEFYSYDPFWGDNAFA